MAIRAVLEDPKDPSTKIWLCKLRTNKRGETRVYISRDLMLELEKDGWNKKDELLATIRRGYSRGPVLNLSKDLGHYESTKKSQKGSLQTENNVEK